MKISAVIFDLDGTLIDSEPIHMASWNQILKPFGVTYSFEAYKSCVGIGDFEFASATVRQHRLAADPQQLVQLKIALYRDLVRNVDLREGVAELLVALQEKGVKLAVASSESSAVIREILGNKGIDRYFSAVIGSDRVRRKKPDPECYLLAMEELNVTAAEALAIEDSTAGVQAACNAKIPVIAVPHRFTKGATFPGALFIANSFAEVASIF